MGGRQHAAEQGDIFTLQLQLITAEHPTPHQHLLVIALLRVRGAFAELLLWGSKIILFCFNLILTFLGMSVGCDNVISNRNGSRGHLQTYLHCLETAPISTVQYRGGVTAAASLPTAHKCLGYHENYNVLIMIRAGSSEPCQ